MSGVLSSFDRLAFSSQLGRLEAKLCNLKSLVDLKENHSDMNGGMSDSDNSFDGAHVGPASRHEIRYFRTKATMKFDSRGGIAFR